MKVLVTDYTFGELIVETAVLAPLGVTPIGAQCKTPADLLELVRDADYVITQFAPINREVIEAMQQSRIIVRYGIGVDNVDLEAAQERGIPVCNVPDYCIDEVADHTLAFILAATRQVVANCNGVRAGRWKLATELSRMQTLRDLTVGIVGLGRIGKEVVARLRPFKCRLLVHDPLVTGPAVESLGATAVSLDELYAQSDVITLHCPSTADTRALVSAATLQKMKRGVILVNLARGNLIVSGDLCAALASGQVGAAALDVFDPEPIPNDNPILKMENVIVAPHIASTSVRAVRTLRETAAQLVARRIRGESLMNVVNGVNV